MTEHEDLLPELEPPREFADSLRTRLRDLDASARRPPHLWAMAAAYAGSGLALLLIAVVGVGI